MVMSLCVVLLLQRLPPLLKQIPIIIWLLVVVVVAAVANCYLDAAGAEHEIPVFEHFLWQFLILFPLPSLVCLDLVSGITSQYQPNMLVRGSRCCHGTRIQGWHCIGCLNQGYQNSLDDGANQCNFAASLSLCLVDRIIKHGK